MDYEASGLQERRTGAKYLGHDPTQCSAEKSDLLLRGTLSFGASLGSIEGPL